MFPESIERFRSLVPDSVPAALVLATIRAESAGKIGARAGRGTASKHDSACGLDPSLVHKCLGLGQIAGVTLATYNANNPSDPVTSCQLAGDTWEDARAQVKVCAWLVGWCLRKVHQEDPIRAPWPVGELLQDQALQADLIYSHGPGEWHDKRTAILADGDVPTFAAFKERFPGWGSGTHETPFKHAEKVVAWAWADFADLAGTIDPIPVPDPEPSPSPVSGSDSGSVSPIVVVGSVLLVGLLLALIAYYMNADPFVDAV